MRKMLRKIRYTAAVVGIFSLLWSFVSFGMVYASHGPSSDAPYGPGPGSTVSVPQNSGSASSGSHAVGPGVTQQTADTGGSTGGMIAGAGGRTIDPSRPMIALTYDDGPHPQVGNRIMDVFVKYGQRCTFFVVGDRVPSRADEIRRMAQEGFEIGNHTYSHQYLNRCDAAGVRTEVAKCNDILAQTCGITPKVMRLPGGNKNETVLQNVGMPIILWNVDTRDWEHRQSAKTIAAVEGKVKDGDIILMHELYSSTADATEYLVPRLVEAGFQLVTVSELAQAKGLDPAANQIYYSMK